MLCRVASVEGFFGIYMQFDQTQVFDRKSRAYPT